MNKFKVGDTVRGLVPLILSDRPHECPAGYQYTVREVNENGSILIISRDEVAGRCDCAAVSSSLVEPAYVIHNGLYYSSRALPEAIRALDNARQRGVRIRVSHGYTETHIGDKSKKEIGEDWLEENDCTGIIGNSGGRIRVPLLINNSRSSGGSSIDGSSIVKIVETKGGRILYQHPKYRLPKFEIRLVTDEALKNDGYTHEVLADGEVTARFKSEAGAGRYMKKFEQ